MRTSRPCLGIIPSYTLAALGAVALFGTTAQAADLVPTALPPLTTETWTGFSVGVGGGVAFMNADLNSKVSRTNEVGECNGIITLSTGAEVTPDDFIGAPCDLTPSG